MYSSYYRNYICAGKVINLNSLEICFDVGDEKIKKLVDILIEQSKKVEVCEREGHRDSEFVCIEGVIGSPRARYYCHDCGAFYNRALTDEQWEKYQRIMSEPFMKSG